MDRSSTARSLDAGGAPVSAQGVRQPPAMIAPEQGEPNRSTKTPCPSIVVNGIEMTAKHFEEDLKDLFPMRGIGRDLVFEDFARQLRLAVGRPCPPIAPPVGGVPQDYSPFPLGAAAVSENDKADDSTTPPPSATPAIVVDGIGVTSLHFSDLKKHYRDIATVPYNGGIDQCMTFKEFARQLSLAVESRKHGRPYPFFVRNLFQANGEPVPFDVEIRSARDLLVVNLKAKLAKKLHSAPLLLKIINQEMDPDADDVEGALLDPSGEYWVTDRKSAPFEDGEWEKFTDTGLSRWLAMCVPAHRQPPADDVTLARRVRAKEFARFLTTENAPRANFIHTLLTGQRGPEEEWSELLKYIIRLAPDETLFTYSVELAPGPTSPRARDTPAPRTRSGILCDLLFHCRWFAFLSGRDRFSFAGTLVRTIIDRFPAALPVVFGSTDGRADRVLNAMLDCSIDEDLWNWSIGMLATIFHPGRGLDKAHIANYVNPGAGSITFVYHLANILIFNVGNLLQDRGKAANPEARTVFEWIVQSPSTTLGTLTNGNPLGLLDTAIVREGSTSSPWLEDLSLVHIDLKASRDALAAAISARQAGPAGLLDR